LPQGEPAQKKNSGRARRSEAILGAAIRGSTNLRLNIPISDLASALDRSVTLFSSDAYKKTWPEIDNVNPVKGEDVIAQLELELDKQLASDDGIKKVVLFTPMHKRDEMVPIDSYVFGRMSKSPAKAPYLMMGGWLSFLAQKGLSRFLLPHKRPGTPRSIYWMMLKTRSGPATSSTAFAPS
jgi:uncharacterized protein (TIGR04141 family)